MNQKFRFTAEPRSALCLLSMALMLLSAAARLWYYLADPVATAMTLSQADIGLPVFSAALYPVLLALFGRRTIVPLTAPVAGFVVFFLYKALSFSSVLHTVLCSILYLAVLVFFLLTALGVLRTRIFLILLAGLPLLVHIIMDFSDYESFFRFFPCLTPRSGQSASTSTAGNRHSSLSKKSLWAFSSSCFPNCKIKFCSMILQFCRCGG